MIFVGLDGADWQLLDQYMARGVMPNLKRLTAEGTAGTVETLHPPLSPIVWTTMMTGVDPLEHRILDFVRLNPATGQKEPITSDERKAPAIWNMATWAGRHVGVFGLWATYPAESGEWRDGVGPAVFVPLQGGEPTRGRRLPRRARKHGHARSSTA